MSKQLYSEEANKRQIFSYGDSGILNLIYV